MANLVEPVIENYVHFIRLNSGKFNSKMSQKLRLSSFRILSLAEVDERLPIAERRFYISFGAVCMISLASNKQIL